MPTEDPTVREVVRQKFGEAALNVMSHQAASCCGHNPADPCCSSDPISGNLYSDAEASEIPETAFLASLGCGNPTALAALKEGETVLDLGSGGGIDVLLSAKRVGPAGFAYGLDMTDEMLALAEENKVKAGVENVRFLKGHIEEIPLPDDSVDVVISNCVINLSGDKAKVLKEAFRVLKLGGRFAVSDVVVDGELPLDIRQDMEAYIGCVAGALERTEYLRLLSDAGFKDPTIEPTRRYTFSDLEALANLSQSEGAELAGRIYSAFIRAQK